MASSTRSKASSFTPSDISETKGPTPDRERGRTPVRPLPARQHIRCKQAATTSLPSSAGSLPRPDNLIEANRAREAGETTDEAAFQATLRKTVIDVVRRQKDAGIDVPGDGEFGKSMGHKVNYRAWWSYSFNRLAGLDLAGPGMNEIPPKRSRPGEIVLSGNADRRDRQKFLAVYTDPEGSVYTGPRAPSWPVCVGPISYKGHAAIKSDIAHFQAALKANGIKEGFMTSVAPGSAARLDNIFYKTDEEFLFACADAMREEYKAIVDAGLILQLDDPSIAESWDLVNPEPSVKDYQKYSHDPRRSAQSCRSSDLPTGPHSLPFMLGKLAWPAHHRYPDARYCRGDVGC